MDPKIIPRTMTTSSLLITLLRAYRHLGLLVAR